jgi:hypothetical protein
VILVLETMKLLEKLDAIAEKASQTDLGKAI